MGGSFETSEAHANFHLKPLRVAVRAEDVYAEARDMVGDLSGWKVVATWLACTTLRSEFPQVVAPT